VADNPKLARRISKMRESGKTYQAIADALNMEKVPTLRGGTEVDGVRGQRSGRVRAAPSEKKGGGTTTCRSITPVGLSAVPAPTAR